MQGVLCSAGFEFDIRVWMLISSNMYPLMKLKGHRAPLVHVAVMPGEYRAVSLDETGKMIWWD